MKPSDMHAQLCHVIGCASFSTPPKPQVHNQFHHLTMISFLSLVLLHLYAVAALNSTLQPPLGLKYIPSHSNRILPLLRLPYATYRASQYDANDDIYTFTNIRFAAPPTGQNRFKRPARPKKMLKI